MRIEDLQPREDKDFEDFKEVESGADEKIVQEDEELSKNKVVEIAEVYDSPNLDELIKSEVEKIDSGEITAEQLDERVSQNLGLRHRLGWSLPCDVELLRNNSVFSRRCGLELVCKQCKGICRVEEPAKIKAGLKNFVCTNCKRKNHSDKVRESLQIESNKLKNRLSRRLNSLKFTCEHKKKILSDDEKAALQNRVTAILEAKKREDEVKLKQEEQQDKQDGLYVKDT
jgi:hypothetical protein